MHHFLSTEYRRMKKNIQAWKTNLLDGADQEEARRETGPVVPVGRPVLIGPFEEVQVVRRTCINDKAMALVLWRNGKHLVLDDDLTHRSIQLFGPIRPHMLSS
jgi:hypothetical protein